MIYIIVLMSIVADELMTLILFVSVPDGAGDTSAAVSPPRIRKGKLSLLYHYLRSFPFCPICNSVIKPLPSLVLLSIS